MDSINSRENETSDRKNAAVNTEPCSVCAFCGSRNYLQPSSQTNCFRAFSSGSGRHEDEFSSQEPIFSSPPLFQPIYQSKLVPPTVFYGNMNDQLPEPRTRADAEKMPKHNPQFFMFYPPSEEMGPNPKTNERQGESGPEMGTNQENRPPFPSSKMSSAANMIPWTCGPCIVPMVSYFVSWNPMYPNKRQSESPAVGKTSQETILPHGGDREEQERTIGLPESSEKPSWKPPLTGSCTSFVSIGSVDCSEEARGLKTQSKSGEPTADRLEDVEEVLNDNEVDTILQAQENDCSYTVNSDSLEGSFIKGSSVPSTAASDAELSTSNTQIPNDGEDYDENEENPLVPGNQQSLSSTEKLEKGLQGEHLVQKNADRGDTDTVLPFIITHTFPGSISKERNPIKFINNFTMSDEGKPKMEEDGKECDNDRTAAAGDVLDQNRPDEISFPGQKPPPESETIATSVVPHKSTENLIKELEAGERPLTADDDVISKSTKCIMGKSATATKTKDSTVSLDSRQGDTSSKKPTNPIAKRKQYLSPKPIPKNPADALLQVPKSKTRSVVQSKGFENLKMKMATINLKEDLSKKKELKMRQNVALEKDTLKSSPRSRK